ncbi:nitroreductase family protein [Methanobrevibacter sp.]|uniref:nitroreductase family protein n=1 Tax=Methanobrevibacter sp. TaxID=66852 RepID=UPI0026E0C1A7|nr:nitroreductase family protein [Methanobrevibacter sp.]MDO5823462.1 nitroreductase family protein [Methanobrevibacter sp.]
MNQTINDLKSRRSIRKFKDKQISDEDLNIILETGTYAPTARGAQSPKIIVIQNPETIKELSAWNRSFFPVEMPEDMDPFYGAKTLIIVLADSEIPTFVEDGSSVLTVLVNAAHAIGVGSCWIHRARDEFSSKKGKELLRKWGIPETYEGVGHVVLGYPDMETPEPIPRKEDYILRID